jgi:opacity protein-like surface antigen
MRPAKSPVIESGGNMRKTVSTIVLAFMPFTAVAQGMDRSGGWEWSVAGVFQQSKNVGSEGGSTLDVDEGIGIGFSFGYNFSNKLTLGLDVDYLKPDYRAVLIEDAIPPTSTTIDHEFTQFNTRIKATYNLMDAPLTPFLEAGFGWTFVDSNVADGPPITGCWWHPFWGYICDSFYNTFTETSFSYGAGVGLRYQFVGGTFVKASYNVWEMDGVGQSQDPTVGAARIEVGWGF